MDNDRAKIQQDRGVVSTSSKRVGAQRSVPVADVAQEKAVGRDDDVKSVSEVGLVDVNAATGPASHLPAGVGG